MLVALLEKDAVPFDVLHARYGSLLKLVETLIGVVPNCDRYLEIWPTAFRTYNVMVPNFLNLPFLIWGMGAPKATLGLAMYVSSRAASCPYCSAHTCSFALRRGATVEQVASALDHDASLSPADRAAVRIARALSVIPADLHEEDRRELARHFSPGDIEWLVLSIAMMGWLNKTMDALGVPLEQATAAEVNPVIAASGWTPGQHLATPPANGRPPRPDTALTSLGVVRRAPRALALDRKWTAGVPHRWPAVGTYLRERTGHDFPVLARLRHGRAIRAIATMLKDNLIEGGSIPRAEKLAAGLVYAETVRDAPLVEDLRALGGKEAPESAVQRLARAVAPSPAAVDAAVVESSRGLAPAAVVELVTFVALLQMLHRLSTYYARS